MDYTGVLGMDSDVCLEETLDPFIRRVSTPNHDNAISFLATPAYSWYPYIGASRQYREPAKDQPLLDALNAKYYGLNTHMMWLQPCRALAAELRQRAASGCFVPWSNTEQVTSHEDSNESTRPSASARK